MTDTIPEWCAPYIGLPFVDRGRGARGVDCYGLCCMVYQEQFGIALPSLLGGYGSCNDKLAVARLFFQETTRSPIWTRVPLEDARLGDILSIHYVAMWHVGIVVAHERFLHVLPGRETCVERLRPSWYSRVDAVYRHHERLDV